jgi:hypothetical protein
MLIGYLISPFSGMAALPYFAFDTHLVGMPPGRSKCGALLRGTRNMGCEKPGNKDLWGGIEMQRK